MTFEDSEFGFRIPRFNKNTTQHEALKLRLSRQPAMLRLCAGNLVRAQMRGKNAIHPKQEARIQKGRQSGGICLGRRSCRKVKMNVLSNWNPRGSVNPALTHANTSQEMCYNILKCTYLKNSDVQQLQKKLGTESGCIQPCTLETCQLSQGLNIITCLRR